MVGVLTLVGSRHMLNLTINELHTYYVLAGKTPVLVHNSPLFGCGIGPADGLGDRLPAFVDGGDTLGIFSGGGIERNLASGVAGPASSLPKGAPGFNGLVKSHVEGHAAALMRQNGIRALSCISTECRAVQVIAVQRCCRICFRKVPPSVSMGRMGTIEPSLDSRTERLKHGSDHVGRQRQRGGRCFRRRVARQAD